MSLISTLGNTSAALTAFSKAIDAEGQNVANAATPGYAALRTSIQPIGPTGSTASADYAVTTSAGDIRADAQVQAASSDAAWSQTAAQVIEPINQLFDITGSSGLLSAFQQFTGAFADLAVTPNDPILRTTALSSLDSVAAAFRKVAAAIDAQRNQIESGIRDVSGEINRLAGTVAEANARLRASPELDPVQQAIRRNALDQLSSLIDISVTPTPDGSLSVLAGGRQLLVSGDQAYTLSVDVSAAVPHQVATTASADSPGFYGGKLGALLDVRNNLIANLAGDDSGPGTLNTLAKWFAERVNTLFSNGLTATGGPGIPVLTFDSFSERNAARTLAVDSSVTTEQLALASQGPPLQANGVANALAGFFASTNAADRIGGVSPQDFYSSIGTRVGQRLSNARDQASVTQSALTAAVAHRQKVSGVSLDEAAVAITSLQRFYQASAKLVSVLDTLTTTEINLIR